MDKKLRRQKWSQCHAWDKKYQLFGTGESAVLIYREGQEGSTKKAAAEAAAVTNAETAAAADRRASPLEADARGVPWVVACVAEQDEPLVAAALALHARPLVHPGRALRALFA